MPIGNGPALYTGDPRGAVLPADYLIATTDDVGRIGRLPGALPGAPYRRPSGIYAGSEGIESLGPINALGGLIGGNTTIVTTAMSPYTVLPTDETLLISAVGPIQINLRSGITDKGKRLTCHRLDFTAVSVTYVPVAGENINGNATLVAINPGASYGVLQFDAVGDDGIGFVKGWSLIVGTQGGYVELTTGPSFTPTLALMKLGSATRSFQPYTRGLYLSDQQLFTAADSPVQLQSYMCASAFDTTAGAIVANLNLAGGQGQLRCLSVYGNPLNTLTINPAGADTIDGAAALVMTPGLAGFQGRVLVGFTGRWNTVAAF